MSDPKFNALPEPVAFCPFCAAKYAPEVVLPVQRTDQRRVMHAKCQACDHSMLFAFERRGTQTACLGVLTDCDAAEARVYLKTPKISLDEVLSLHVQLQKSVIPGPALT